MKHYPVLLKEIISNLNVKADGIYVDGTLGRAGHTIEIAKLLNNGHLYSFDQDHQAIEEAKELISLKKLQSKITIIHDNFVNIKANLKLLNIQKVDGFIFDLGVSSPQFDEDFRGFSYNKNADLDMRMNLNSSLTAKNIINNYSYEKLIEIFFNYGEEKFSKSIAKKIIEVREKKDINTTFDLVEIIKSSLPQKELKKQGHPAKKIFQALRIEVNNELEVLKNALNDCLTLLGIGGRILIITFHSLEDRIVKNIFKKMTTDPNFEINKKLPTINNYSSDFNVINKKPIVSSKKELEENRRSRSAKLRIIERVK
ncbi:16S rRNA (cytosine(1402)-N(4))-methyltransferase RsmH [Spiroplasma endosymbiont of Anurida maritima]|uniref:16S rRNA (cytosine(1402)-N(4))-methyltransferase RsmH n=1 Tax=Spiroplasma endosymbiont of Anurida maritima TaxID=2967972 RepID=UPI0036D34ACA